MKINNNTFEQLKSLMYESNTNGYKASKQLEYYGYFTKIGNFLEIEDFFKGEKYSCEPDDSQYTFHTHPITFTKKYFTYRNNNIPNIISDADLKSTILYNNLIDGKNIFDMVICPIGIYIYGVDPQGSLITEWQKIKSDTWFWKKNEMIEKFSKIIDYKIHKLNKIEWKYVGILDNKEKEMKRIYYNRSRYHPYKQMEICMNENIEKSTYMKKYLQALQNLGIKTFFFSWNNRQNIQFDF